MGASARSSVTQSPWQSPYTPVVLIKTPGRPFAGILRAVNEVAQSPVLITVRLRGRKPVQHPPAQKLLRGTIALKVRTHGVDALSIKTLSALGRSDHR